MWQVFVLYWSWMCGNMPICWTTNRPNEGNILRVSSQMWTGRSWLNAYKDNPESFVKCPLILIEVFWEGRLNQCNTCLLIRMRVTESLTTMIRECWKSPGQICRRLASPQHITGLLPILKEGWISFFSDPNPVSDHNAFPTTTHFLILTLYRNLLRLLHPLQKSQAKDEFSAVNVLQRSASSRALYPIVPLPFLMMKVGEYSKFSGLQITPALVKGGLVFWYPKLKSVKLHSESRPGFNWIRSDDGGDN